MTKVCKECGEEKPLSGFHKGASCKQGVRPECKDCVHVKRAKYYADNAEKARAYSRDFYHANVDMVKAYQKQYDQRYKWKVRGYRKRWREANRDRLLVVKREYYGANREHFAALGRLYKQHHPEHGRTSHPRRRAKVFAAPGSFTGKQILEKIEFHGWRCYLCKKILTFRELHLDHRIPFVKGGTNWIANIAPACEPCNLAKGQRTEREYRAVM